MQLDPQIVGGKVQIRCEAIIHNRERDAGVTPTDESTSRMTGHLGQIVEIQPAASKGRSDAPMRSRRRRLDCDKGLSGVWIIIEDPRREFTPEYSCSLSDAERASAPGRMSPKRIFSTLPRIESDSASSCHVSAQSQLQRLGDLPRVPVPTFERDRDKRVGKDRRRAPFALGQG